MNPRTPHLLLAGGGLANALLALRMKRTHPDTRITILEAGPEPGGNHTWSFHAGDLSAEQHAFVAPMVRHRWPTQEVRFPGYTRRLDNGYASITSESLRAVIDDAGIELRTDTRVVALEPRALVIDSGERLEGSAVIDGRGQARAGGLVLGFQKFFGREVETATPHGIDVPVIMDATVSQADGYRFVYLLPFSASRLLIEDTRYSDGAALDDVDLSAAIDDYAAAQGWTLTRTIREERGILPILIAADFDRFWPADAPVARAGLRAALFHPTTGYSLPQALALADAICDRWPMDGPALARFTRDHARRLWTTTAFFRVLNRFLFRAGEPDERYKVMERFYTLSEALVENFYAARLPWYHKARLVVGKPPVPFFKALSVIPERRMFLTRDEGEGTRE
ncbi:lycopene beta-cyclase CrtY [Wenzhouxiangella sp. XN79A]|uniref:lycopene beta-cyclase CrtY n=1 Tax=Wenzhouxiangella sp. XN79A TaxID=2724193 RepID=UPI00144A6031|nr:lycopene beta-cyclase CrtY [Wenzhouxiangella sp. XN79A]NKI34851.1 lycopene beta-cyclase CrtY [Wenzhouxiangella sp. XN79A]